MFNRYDEDDKIPAFYFLIILIFVAAPCLIAGAWLGWFTR
ncbi:conserved hypothetical protein [Frankia canadensis]|uniref:Uncharacterized protein n=1 Tax=Frankia canadensis TaxID=1836972 RepID=A0A2I2KN03_9ACTN|nr:conserved hypothetical protein [Frankia canadensis]SOU54326.1 conserved hypothetical protein [Frankia canadensis]